MRPSAIARQPRGDERVDLLLNHTLALHALRICFFCDPDALAAHLRDLAERLRQSG